MLVMTFQSKFPASLMFWLIKVFYVIVVLKQKIIFNLEWISACHNTKLALVMYFTVNKAFVNYFDNLTDSLEVPILQN